MTEYLDELICLFRKARPGTFVQFQDEEVKNCLINGLPFEILSEVQGYLDLLAEEIAWKYDLLHSQWEALAISSAIEAGKALHVVQDRYIGSDETYSINKLEHILAYKDGDHLNKFKDETFTYFTKKGHTETLYFSKRDDEKLARLTDKCSIVMAEKFAASNKEAMESILNKPDKFKT